MLLERLQPAEAGDIHTALTLDRFDDDSRRDVHAAALVLDDAFQVLNRVDAAAEIAVVRHERRVGKRYAGRVAKLGVTRRR